MIDFKETITDEYPFWHIPNQRGRQLAFPERINCYSIHQFFSRFNELNGRKRKLYYSIYCTNLKGEFQDWEGKWDVVIDLIAFDLDNEKKQENIRKLFEYCKSHNYRSLYVFSTNGFWCYISTTGARLRDPKVALDKAQRHIAEELGFKIAKGKEGDIDETIVGDVKRITRAINSYDCDRKRYCINLRANELYMSFEEICKIAQKQRVEYYWYGEKLFDLVPFDIKAGETSMSSYKYHSPNQSVEKIDVTGIQMEIPLEEFLPCIRRWLTEPQTGHYKARYWFAVACKNMVIPQKVCDNIAKEFFSKAPRTDRLGNNYNHFKKDNVIRKAYSEDKIFPNCESLILSKDCPGKCEKYKGKNSPLYYT